MFSCKTCNTRADEGRHENISEHWEEKLFGEIGMQRARDYEIYDSLFEYPNGELGHIHTIEAGDVKLQPLVLIHGYGSGAIFYYKVIAELRHRFHIYSIDLNGMGSSARRPITNFDFNHVVDFFVDALELWRIKIGLRDFVLMGHSMGGYISGHWMRLKKPPVKLLYLLSPAGFTNKETTTFKGEKTLFMKGILAVLWQYLVQEWKFSPLSFLPGKIHSFRYYFKTRPLLNLPESECEILAKYLVSVLDKNESGERAVGILLNFARYSNYPICQILHEIRHDQGFSYPIDRKSTRLNSSHVSQSRMPSSA